MGRNRPGAISEKASPGASGGGPRPGLGFLPSRQNKRGLSWQPLPKMLGTFLG